MGQPSTAEASAATGELVARIRAGDRQAETELVERYGERLGFLLRRWSRDAATADDLWQETFGLAIAKIRHGELREPEKLAGFLRGLARNVSLYHYRRDDRRAAWHAAPEEAVNVPDPKTNVLGELLLKEKTSLVRRLLAELPGERDREVLARFYIAEEDKERICRDLGLARDHFKRVLHRARQRYRDLFEARVREREVVT